MVHTQRDWAATHYEGAIKMRDENTPSMFHVLMAAIVGAIAGGLVVALATKAVPKMMPRLMAGMMHKRMAKMSASGRDPATI